MKEPALTTDSVDLTCILGRRPKIVIGHPHLGRGGSEARVMWLIEALKRDCQLTVVTTGGWDLDGLNRAYNTHVKPEDVTVLVAPFPRILRRYNAAALRYGYYQRFCRKIAHRFDLCISAYNCTDWGRPAIHFIADFCWAHGLTATATGRTPGFIYRDTVLRRLYLAWARRVVAPSERDPLREDLLLPTSRWGACILKRDWGAQRVEPLYPFLHSPADNSIDRESLCAEEIPFLSISRIAVEKRLEDAIHILLALRKRGHPIRLYLAGKIGSDEYGRRIRGICHDNSNWISTVGWVSGADKQHLFGTVAFAISTCRQEMFGNAVAEMLSGGIIPFAHKEGGPAELLNHPMLLFESNEEAIEKIGCVLSDPALAGELRLHLRNMARLFSLETTIRTVRSIVAENLG